MKKFFPLFSVSCLFLCLIFLQSCSTAPPYHTDKPYGADELVMDSYKLRQGKFSILEMEGKKTEELDPELLEPYEDVIVNGDILSLSIYHPSRKDLIDSIERIRCSVGFVVRDEKLSLPDIEPIEVAGKTLSGAKQAIDAAYQKELKGVEVYLSYKDRLEKRVELAGEVRVPSIIVDGKTRLFDVLAKAQIPTTANLFSSYVVRGQQFVPVDLNHLIRQGDMSQNIVMKGGDKIYIADPSSANIMMLGELTQRGLIPMSSGTMPLREAIAKAGGIPYTGDRSYIQVIRGNILKPKIYTVHWKHVIRLPSNSLLLMPGDIVYVAATPITEWNRFISQLFPSFTAIDLFCKSMTGVVTLP